LTGSFHRLSEKDRPTVEFFIDGRAATGLEGDMLLVAILNQAEALRHSEFGDGPRAGFCLMGACQDCWVRLENGTSARACTTPVDAGMRVLTKASGAQWLTNGS